MIVVILLAMIGLRVGGDEYRAVREEAEKLALLMQAAREEAILQGTVLGLSLDEENYRFLRLAREKKTGELRFDPLEREDLLRPRTLPPAMTVKSVLLDGAPAGEEPVVFTLTGELLQAVVITFAQGEARWLVKGDLDGRIVAEGPNG